MPKARQTGAPGDTLTCVYRQFGFEQLPLAKCKHMAVLSGVRSCERSQDSPLGQDPVWRNSLHTAVLEGSCTYRHLGPLGHEPKKLSLAETQFLPYFAWTRKFCATWKEREVPVVVNILHGSLILLTVPFFLGGVVSVVRFMYHLRYYRFNKFTYRYALMIPARYMFPFLLRWNLVPAITAVFGVDLASPAFRSNFISTRRSSEL